MKNSKGINWFSTLLVILVGINVIGDFGNIALWHLEPSLQESLMGGYIAALTGAGNALTAGTIILVIVAIIYIASIPDLLKNLKWATLLVIAISIANRALAVFLYLFNEFFFLWFAWTIILLTVAYLNFSKISSNQ